MKIIGLIPARLNSSRLPQKSLLEIEGIPLVIHTYRRAKLSKKLDELFICCDDEKIMNVAKKFKAKAIMTSSHHANGTERICEGYLKIKKKYDIIVDIQGDEPLISPYHIDQVINFHIKNKNIDIVLPHLIVENLNNPNLVKIVSDKVGNVLYISRAQIPFSFKKPSIKIKKHLSIISFLPEALIEYAKNKRTNLEKIEDVELLRALEIGLKIKTLKMKGDSFSVDIMKDFKNAKLKMKDDKIFKIYK
tara:strand:- start:3759 stop:4502 length:744 start_codon:yes stop_codon:yes gene_type:complete